MNAAPRLIAVASKPSFFRGEADDRREPAHEAIEAVVEHGSQCAPPDCARRIAVEAVLADVEVEGRQVSRAEIMKRGKHPMEAKSLDRTSHQLVELCQAVQDPAFELRHCLG